VGRCVSCVVVVFAVEENGTYGMFVVVCVCLSVFRMYTYKYPILHVFMDELRKECTKSSRVCLGIVPRVAVISIPYKEKFK